MLVISPTKHGDERGFFSEVYRHDALAGYGVDLCSIQDNHVPSAARGVLRGLHFQPAPIGRLSRRAARPDPGLSMRIFVTGAQGQIAHSLSEATAMTADVVGLGARSGLDLG